MSDETSLQVQEPQTAIAVRSEGSAWALARLTDEQFAATMEAAKKGRQRLQIVMRNMMTEGIHFGKIPGTDKPTLLKPGSEVLCQMFHLVPDVHATVIYGDGKTSPQITVKSRCTLHLGCIEGDTVGVGEGAANSWEKKWRYRQSERICPACQKPTIIKGKEEYGGGWLCWAKKGGCGAKFADNAEAIVSQDVGQVENPDPYELLNTITKIANKRAKLDATITATASSDLLTQDMDESEPPAGEKPAEKKQKAAPNPAAMKLLKAAAEKGTASLESAWKAITQDQRVSCKDELAALKAQAAQVQRQPGDEP